jgi:hypothetical protein
MPISLCAGDAKSGGRFLDGAAGIESQLHYLGCLVVFSGELGESFIESDDILRGPADRGHIRQIDTTAVAATAKAFLSAGIFDQDTAHGFGRGGEEVAPIVPVLIRFLAYESKVGLMNQARGLKRLTGFLLGQLRRRQLPQLVIDKWQQPFGGRRIALPNLIQSPRHIIHNGEIVHLG